MPSEVDLDNIQDGAILAADVLDGRGNVLLAAGTRMTGAHVSLIRRRGVEKVEIRNEEKGGTEADTGSAQEGNRIAELLKQQEQVFSRVKDQPRMAAILAAAREHIQNGNLPPV